MDNVNKMMNEQMVAGMNRVSDEKSSVCEAWASNTAVHIPHSERSTPMSVSSFGGSRYFVMLPLSIITPDTPVSTS